MLIYTISTGYHSRKDDEPRRTTSGGQDNARLANQLQVEPGEEPTNPRADQLHGRPLGGEAGALHSYGRAGGHVVYRHQENADTASVLLYAVL